MLMSQSHGRMMRAGRRSCPVSRRTSVACTASSKAKFFVGGNWKANGTVASVNKLIQDLNAGTVPQDVDVVVAPTYVHLDLVRQKIDSSKYQVSAQNVWSRGTGAFTGEIPAEILVDMGIKWTITGHSERRSLCAESNEMVAQKTARALEQGLNVIACIGETLDQRNNGEMFPVLDAQLHAIVEHVPLKDWNRVVIAYEPVWAIGTGVVATPEQAQEVHAHLRERLIKELGADTASKQRIIYGGSVNDKNCADLAKRPDIDGFLVGGASLQGPAFLTIIGSHSVKKASAAAA